ncbi:NAD-dependent epimerase/dehydratase family protein [Flavobacterium silvaticum]|uniref:NAD(P)-dependent oxidoreductase n=1 Tax=Flavobacterium silvaticum TaxID=1852020 RepID=A0A972FPM2_9FLAO|nr:NAD(P)-dependent oxidoreductase [Flavobacterium silvaticum]NMH29522.1 NAD(P)-dependent oxidoreductase [Flavobacterium silvaticum]
MKVLITGISGFLGSHLETALSNEFDVVGLYHSKPASGFGIPMFSNLSEIPTDVDAVVMCHAAVSSGTHKADSKFLFEANVERTQEIVSAFPDAFLVYVSTVGVFGNTDFVIDEASAVNPQSEYTASKLEGETSVRSAKQQVILRLSSLYGQRMKENTLIPNYINQALQNGKIEVWGNGSRLQNYIFVDDVCALIRQMLISRPVSSIPFLGVSDREYSNLEIAQKIAELTHAKIEFVNTDSSPSIRFDNALTRKAVNWQPETTIEQGLRAYIAWKKKQS